MTSRRRFLSSLALATGAASLPLRALGESFGQSQSTPTSPRPHPADVRAQAATVPDPSAPSIPFPSADPRWSRTWSAAIATLSSNIQRLPGVDGLVLLEGSFYAGVWQECGPHEALVYSRLAHHLPPREDGLTPHAIARNAHLAFFLNQSPDGQLPADIRSSGMGFGQIQMVVPLAATALELIEATGDDELLVIAYNACSRWDAWLRQYRDTRKTGLVEGFCTYDTGMDNSPRWAGIPDDCPDGDARICPPIPTLPRLCPDLSATTYGARVALAAMAATLGKGDESARWLADAEHLRQLILSRLYSPEDASFFDLDAKNNFVRVRSDINTRVLGEHVLKLSEPADHKLFTDLWTRQLHNPRAFWSPFPFPSVALDDPAFVRPIPPNSWGGASQALTALRTLRWMPHYGRTAELNVLMRAWTEATLRHGEFHQQLDPVTGVFTDDPGGYSPAALAFLEFTHRLSRAHPDSTTIPIAT